MIIYLCFYWTNSACPVFWTLYISGFRGLGSFFFLGTSCQKEWIALFSRFHTDMKFVKQFARPQFWRPNIYAENNPWQIRPHTLHEPSPTPLEHFSPSIVTVRVMRRSLPVHGRGHLQGSGHPETEKQEGDQSPKYLHLSRTLTSPSSLLRSSCAWKLAEIAVESSPRF